MGKLIMLASLLAKLDTNSKAAFIGELSELIDTKTGGLGFSISENDILKTVEPSDLTSKEKTEEEKGIRFKEKVKEFNYHFYEAKKAAGFNITEM